MLRQLRHAAAADGLIISPLHAQLFRCYAATPRCLRMLPLML